jgi:pyridoxamine 5'-phosphate oxidase
MRKAAFTFDRLVRSRKHTAMATDRSPANPPWKQTLTDILQKNLDDGHKESLNFSLATIKPGPEPRPAVRTVVFRGFVGEPRDTNPPEKLPGGNPPVESSLILVTTDALMAKVGEIEESNGAYEVCWWHAGTNQQIRFSGTAYLYRRNGNADFPETELKRFIAPSNAWNWDGERTRQWKAHRPAMRGSFRNPPPGSSMDEEKRKKLETVELDSEDDGSDAQEAKQRFSLLILEIAELEFLDLDPPPVCLIILILNLIDMCSAQGLRRRWALSIGRDGTTDWHETEVCP